MGKRKTKQHQEKRDPERMSRKYTKKIQMKEEKEKAEARSFSAVRNALSANMTDITGEECKL